MSLADPGCGAGDDRRPARLRALLSLCDFTLDIGGTRSTNGGMYHQMRAGFCRGLSQRFSGGDGNVMMLGHNRMKMTGAECLADMLKGYGVTHVFHVPA